MINNRNHRSREIEHRIEAENWAYYKNQNIMQNKEISRKKNENR